MRKAIDPVVSALTILVACLCGGCSNPFLGAPTHNSYLNQSPPELPIGGLWLNSPEPITFEALRGNVVWLEFSFLS